jgi:hypothetical protein
MHVFLTCWDAVVSGIGDHHWLTIVTGLGAVATAAGVAAGACLAMRYGRRASVSVSAKAYPTLTGIVIATRPVVKAVGIFRVKFHGPKGAVVKVTEIYINDSRELQDGLSRDRDAVFGTQFVEAGEELTTTSVFPPTSPSPRVIGFQSPLPLQVVFLPRVDGGRTRFSFRDRKHLSR